MSVQRPEGREETLRLMLELVGERGLAEADALRALELQRSTQCSFGAALIQLGLASPAEVDAALGRSPTTFPERLPPAGQASSKLIGIRALRTEILLRQTGAKHNSLALVAAARGDGTSRLAAELAIAFAQLDQPTLLIDADLRKPVQQHLFRLGDRPGLTEALTTTERVAYAAIDGLPQLTVLGAGKRPPNPQERLSSTAFADFIVEAQRHFRHIVIDTPDASGSSDSLVIAAVLGAALPVARIDATPLPAYAELVRRLHSASVRIVGGVVNAAIPAP